MVVALMMMTLYSVLHKSTVFFQQQTLMNICFQNRLALGLPLGQCIVLGLGYFLTLPWFPRKVPTLTILFPLLFFMRSRDFDADTLLGYSIGVD